MILLKNFLRLNAKMNKIIKNAKRVELNIKISTAFLNTQTLDII